MMIDWIEIENHKTDNVPPKRILIFTPNDSNPTMIYRVIDGEFLPHCGDATHWAVLTPPEGL